MSESYELYEEPPGVPGDAGPEPESWQVLVEYSNGGQAKPPTLVQVFPTVLPSRDEALVAAEHRAWSFSPPDPLSPRGRKVFRDGDGFLTVVEGAMSTFHFSTRVVRFLGAGQ